MKVLRVTPIASEGDVELLRCIRNSTRAGYSNHNEWISVDQQRAWWLANRERVRGWLYHEDMGIVGFGLLRLDDDGYWRTVVGVLPDSAGHGYGKTITHDIVARAPGPCRATARNNNPAAVKLHVPDDWDIVDGPDPRLLYFQTKPRTDWEEVLDAWSKHGWVVERTYQSWYQDDDRERVTA